MKQISSNEFRVSHGGELYVTEDGFCRIFVEANKDIPLPESKMFADIIWGHFQDGHDDEMETFDGKVYVTVYTIMEHVDVDLNKHSLMFARMFVKLFDAVGDELPSLDLENPEDCPYLRPWVAQAYLEVLRIVGKYLQVAEIWWELQ